MSGSDGIDQECVEAYLYSRTPTRVLLFRRPPARGGYWVPVSGKVEASDADYPAAVRRELGEETGWTPGHPVEPLDWSFPFEGPDGRRWRLHAFSVEVERGFAPRLSDEHDAFEWLTPEEALRRLHYSDNREALSRLLRRLGRAFEDPNAGAIV